MQAEILYSYKRLLAVDLKLIYSKCETTPPAGVNPFLADFDMVADTTVGGIKLTPYLTYDWSVCILCTEYSPFFSPPFIYFFLATILSSSSIRIPLRVPTVAQRPQ